MYPLPRKTSKPQFFSSKKDIQMKGNKKRRMKKGKPAILHSSFITLNFL